MRLHAKEQPVGTGWTEISVDVPRECSDAVANFLIESGSPGLQSTEGVDTITLVAYFASDPPLESLRRFCTGIGCPSAGALAHIRVRHVADEDWAENWKSHFQPQLVGERLYICPSWNCTPPPDRTTVVIDPGMAFGTGQHGSTRGCLDVLERAARTQQITRALDVGTGSGVLAVALVKLGALEVWAIDNDPSACTIAVANTTRNRVHAQVHVTSDFDAVGGTFDLIVANLYTDVLETMAAGLARRLRFGGVLICSGFLTGDEDRLRAAYQLHDLRVTERRDHESWVTLALQRNRE
jgi:ribosomal protein L11 methyltransferase